MTKRRVGHALLVLAAVVGILGMAPGARADSEVRIVRLSYVNGDVQMDRGTGQGFESAVMNMPVTKGSRIWAGDDGYAEVEFEGGSTARLTPGTELSVLELSLRSDGGRVSMLEVQQGTAYFDIRPGSADEFRVTVAGYDLQVPRHTRFRVSGDQDNVRVAVFEGALNVPTGDGQVEVGKNQTLNLVLSDPGRYEVVGSVSEEAYDQWDRDRANYLANYESSGSGSYATSYSPDYSYGVSDLNYWGSYSYISGWGWMWQPYFVYAGWNPWMDGAWVWYPGLGYVWVSAYPWGWMPYRYGGWYFVSGHGWCWRPGRHWDRWVAVAPVHNAPPNFHGPVVPVSGGPHVVPVGRGPVTLYPNPEDRDWHGPRRVVDPGAPGVPVHVAVKNPVRPVSPIPIRRGNEGVAPPATVPAQPVTPVVGGGAGGVKGGEPIRPAPIPMRRAPDEHVTVPAAGSPQPTAPAPEPVRPVTPIPVRTSGERTPVPPAVSTPMPVSPPRRTSDDSGSFRGSGGPPVNTPAPVAPAPPPPPSVPAQSGGHVSGGSGGYHPSPPPSAPAAPRSSGSSGSGWSGGGSSHMSGGSSSGGASHSSGGSSGGGARSSGSSGGSRSSGSSSGTKGPK